MPVVDRVVIVGASCYAERAAVGPLWSTESNSEADWTKANAPSNRAASPLPMGKSDVYGQRQPWLGAVDAGSFASTTNRLLREAQWVAKSPHDVSRSRSTDRSRQQAGRRRRRDPAPGGRCLGMRGGVCPKAAHRPAATTSRSQWRVKRYLHCRRHRSKEGELKFGIRAT